MQFFEATNEAILRALDPATQDGCRPIRKRQQGMAHLSWSAFPILLEHLREENPRLKKQLHDRLHSKQVDQTTREEPPF